MKTLKKVVTAIFATQTGMTIFALAVLAIFIMGPYISDYIQYNVFNMNKTYYYSSFELAMSDVYNETIGDRADLKSESSAAVKIDNQKTGPIVVLLEDVSTAKSFSIYNVTINLNGHSISSTAKVLLNVYGSLTIDGSTEGSKIHVNQDAQSDSRVAVIYEEADIKINGGTYICESYEKNVTCFEVFGWAEINDATIKAMSPGDAVGILSKRTSVVGISHCIVDAKSTLANGSGIVALGIVSAESCDVTATSEQQNAFAVYNSGVTTLKNSALTSNAEARKNAEGKIYLYSVGVYNYGDEAWLELKNCEARGSLTGVWTLGEMRVDGGRYEGCTFGGMIVKTTKDVWLQNAKIVQTKANVEEYVGKTAICITENVNCYIDNCTLDGYICGILVCEENIQDCKVYISNSRIENNGLIQLWESSNQLYYGKGNEFGTDRLQIPENLINTDEIYAREIVIKNREKDNGPE